MKLTIDRWEGDFAVVELPDRSTVNLPKAVVPGKAVPGDVIEIRMAPQATKKRKETVRNLMDELWTK